MKKYTTSIITINSLVLLLSLFSNISFAGDASNEASTQNTNLPEENQIVIKDMVLVLDNSGSMKKNDPKFLSKRAVTQFINKLDHETQLSIVVFDQQVQLAVPFLEVTKDNKKQLLSSLDLIDHKGLYTDSPAAIERAIYELKNNGRENSQKYIVFLTDGIVDTGNPQVDLEKSKWLKQELAADAADNEIKIFAVAFTDSADFQMIQSLAQQTGAEYYRAIKAEQLDDAFEKINALIDEYGVIEKNSLVKETEIAPELTEESAVIPTNELEAITVPSPVVEKPVDRPPLNRDQNITFPIQQEKTLLPYVLLAIFLTLLGCMTYFFYLRPKWNRINDEIYISEAYLKDVHGHTQQKSYKLDSTPAMVGRVETRDNQDLKYITILESTIGRRHAVIEYKDYAFWVVDQGSTNGTYVNDTLIEKETRLKHGDRVRFHKFEFVFEVPELQEDGMTVISSTVLKETIQANARELPEPEFDISMAETDSNKDEHPVDFNIIENSEKLDITSNDETIRPGELAEFDESGSEDATVLRDPEDSEPEQS